MEHKGKGNLSPAPVGVWVQCCGHFRPSEAEEQEVPFSRGCFRWCLETSTGTHAHSCAYTMHKQPPARKQLLVLLASRFKPSRNRVV